MRIYLTSFLLLLLVLGTQAQSISGTVIDAESKEPLAFVNIVSVGTTQGTTTDIDGKFSIPQSDVSALEFSFIGYETLTLTGPFNPDRKLKIALKPSAFILGEVTVSPGLNPAHRIVQRAVRGKEQHNPLNLPAFQYTSYNKFILTLGGDSILVPDTLITPQDSMAKEMATFLKDKNLFLMESVTKRKFKSPNKDEEEVLASRVSGLKTPLFTILATEFQSFSFYPDYIKVLEISYLNPLSKGSTNRYNFVLEDTLFREKDSVYVISYRPNPNTQFNGLKGLLYIHTDGYALVNVTAEPAEENATSVKIQQQYQKVGGHWFPEQLNTDLSLLNVQINAQFPTGTARSYIRNVAIGEIGSDDSFSPASVKIDPDAGRKDSSFWSENRVVPLDAKDSNTYTFIDSLGKAENLDRLVYVSSALISGKLPIGPINLVLDQILDYSEHEGLRLGLGLETNPRFMENAYLKGYWAYGFEDDAVKYGGEIGIRLNNPHQVFAYAKGALDLFEPGNFDSQFTSSSFINRNYRDLSLSGSLNMRTMVAGGLRGHIGPHLQAKTEVRYQDFQPLFPVVQEILLETDVQTLFIGMEYRPKDKKRLTDYGMVSLAQNFPRYEIGIEHDISNPRSPNFTRVYGQAEFVKTWIYIGQSYLKLRAGHVVGNALYPLGFSSYGNRVGNNSFGFGGKGSFETLGFTASLQTTTGSAYLVQDFGPLFGKINFSDYRFRFHLGALYGPDQGSFLPNHVDLRKGYFESGISLSNVLGGLGIGGFFRYQPNQAFDAKRDLVAKLNFSFAL